MRMKVKTEDVFEDELDLSDIKEKKKEMIRLKMEKELLKMQAETEKLKQELEKYKYGNPTNNPTNGTSAVAALAATLIKSGVKPEEANEFLTKLNPEALATLTALTSNNPYLPLFMFLASQTRGQSPQSMTTKEIVEVNKTVFDLAKDIASTKGKGSESEILAIVRELANMYKETQQKLLLEKLEDIAGAMSRKSLWDEILEDEKKFKLLKQLFGGQNTPPEVAIELEKLRQAHELNMKKLDLELLKLQADLAESKRRNEMAATVLRKIGEAIGTGLSEVSEGVGMSQTEQYSYTLKCPKCGMELKDITPGKEITCPQCKTVYKAMVKE